MYNVRSKRGGKRRLEIPELMTEPTKVMVTGGAGFIGSHLVDGLLANGCSVAVVDNLSSGRLRNLDHAATFYHAPINDPRIHQIIQRERPEIIFHLAAQSSVQKSIDDPVADTDSNVLGTVRLLNAAQAAGVHKIVFSSTGGAIYGNPDTIPCDEDTPVNPLTPYALSKYASELYLELFYRFYDLKYTILRYANVYGPGQNPNGEAGVVAIFAGLMLRGRSPYIYGDGEQERDFVYVSDVVEANLAAMHRGDGRIYNIGTGQPVTINRIYSLLQACTKFDQAPVPRGRQRGDVLKIALDPGRAARELGWEPKTSLEEGLRLSVDYVRDASVRRPARARFGDNR